MRQLQIILMVALMVCLSGCATVVDTLLSSEGQIPEWIVGKWVDAETGQYFTFQSDGRFEGFQIMRGVSVTFQDRALPEIEEVEPAELSSWTISGTYKIRTFVSSKERKQLIRVLDLQGLKGFNRFEVLELDSGDAWNRQILVVARSWSQLGFAIVKRKGSDYPFEKAFYLVPEGTTTFYGR